MTLSPKAARLVDQLVSQAESAQAKALWSAAQNVKELSPALATALLPLLTAAESEARRQIDSGELSEDDVADAANDLGLMLAIEADLKRVA
jgi:hypothetical protein